MKYTESQIKAAYDNARLHGYQCPSDQVALEFLDWYHSAKTEYSSEYEALLTAISGLCTNGIKQQEAFWQDNGVKNDH